MTLLILGIILFLATHLIRVVAPGFRLSMIERFGETGWRVINSILSLLSLVVLIWGYATAPFVNVWFPPMGMNHLTITLMLIAMICLVAGFLPAGHIATKTKHPIVLSIKIWAAAHLLANGDLASILLFGALLAWGVVLRINYKRRVRAGDLVLRPFVSARFDAIAVVVGLVVWALITFKLHELLIGVAPLPM
ncbi:NnrU family protein [Rhizobium glycinendophyticum]|uniref:NnrU family protein n=1 Tax=Rhizobium glycinendophyticum TaxID=2589807 RepID=A0A504UY85_9HYPH|nr:NnrU family protein [Rhizobium glycinendophyticum]TPP11731.1 NnrU family protein [Rhizobium glycinendophyticum]